MRAKLLQISQSKEPFYLEAAALYQEKISHFLPFQVETIRPKNLERAQAAQKVELECELILEKLSSKDYVILFDERGVAMDSIKFSQSLVRGFESGRAQVVFVVGGAFGVNDKVRARAQLICSLSTLVMSHLVATVVVLEQVYRALTIWKGLPYHNQ